MKRILLTTAFGMSANMAPAVTAMDQPVSDGTVTAESVIAPAEGWLVVHRTAPGPVVGHAPLVEGENMVGITELTEDVASGFDDAHQLQDPDRECTARSALDCHDLMCQDRSLRVGNSRCCHQGQSGRRYKYFYGIPFFQMYKPPTTK